MHLQPTAYSLCSGVEPRNQVQNLANKQKKPILWGYVLFTVLSIGTNIVPRKKYLYEGGSIEKPALSEILDMTYCNS